MLHTVMIHKSDKILYRYCVIYFLNRNNINAHTHTTRDNKKLTIININKKYFNFL